MRVGHYHTHQFPAHYCNLFQLEARLLESQNEVASLKKDVIHLKEQLTDKNNQIIELSKEIDILTEELIVR